VPLVGPVQHGGKSGLARTLPLAPRVGARSTSVIAACTVFQNSIAMDRAELTRGEESHRPISGFAVKHRASRTSRAARVAVRSMEHVGPSQKSETNDSPRARRKPSKLAVPLARKMRRRPATGRGDGGPHAAFGDVKPKTHFSGLLRPVFEGQEVKRSSRTSAVLNGTP
jgi:hypothetical protein